MKRRVSYDERDGRFFDGLKPAGSKLAKMSFGALPLTERDPSASASAGAFDASEAASFTVSLTVVRASIAFE